MRVVLIILLSFLLLSCDNSQTPELQKPGVVQWVLKSAEMAEEERGIDAVPDTNAIFLQWYRISDRGIRYYKIYRQQDGETFFSLIRQIDIDAATEGLDTTYIDGTITLNRFQSYYITAENTDQVEGDPSDTLRYMLLDKPETSKPNFETVVGLPVFFWSFTTIPDSFILRIEQDFPPYALSFARKFQSDYDNDAQVLDLGQITNPPQFQPDLFYKWRIDAIGYNEQEIGSESQWLRFKVQ